MRQAHRLLKGVVGGILLFFIVFGIVLPKILIHDISGLSDETIVRAHNNASLLLEGLENIRIIETAVVNKVRDDVYVVAYTFFGVPYALLRTEYRGATRLWSNGRFYGSSNEL